MEMTASVAVPGTHTSLRERLNTRWHERSLQVFMLVVLGHWSEHLAQAFQIYVLKWPVAKSLGVLGLWYPWLIKSEVLHYSYAVVMLFGIWLLRPGFTGLSRSWWNVALIIQFWHHIEHALLPGAGHRRAQPAEPAGADEHRADLGPPRRAPPDLQHAGVHSDGDRHVLPHVPAPGRGRPHAMHLRDPAPRRSRGLRSDAPASRNGLAPRTGAGTLPALAPLADGDATAAVRPGRGDDRPRPVRPPARAAEPGHPADLDPLPRRPGARPAGRRQPVLHGLSLHAAARDRAPLPQAEVALAAPAAQQVAVAGPLRARPLLLRAVRPLELPLVDGVADPRLLRRRPRRRRPLPQGVVLQVGLPDRPVQLRRRDDLAAWRSRSPTRESAPPARPSTASRAPARPGTPP